MFPHLSMLVMTLSLNFWDQNIGFWWCWVHFWYF